MKMTCLIICATLFLVIQHGSFEHSNKTNHAKEIGFELNSHEDVLIANVPGNAIKNVDNCFKKAGIVFYGDSGRGAYGIRVRISDVRHAKAILIADSKLYHYEVAFAE